MKNLYLILMLVTFTMGAQIETNVTNLLNTVCESATCGTVQLGACLGDLDSDGDPLDDIYTGFNVYYVTEDIILDVDMVILRNARLEFRNGANFVDNGILVDEQTDCDTDNVTEIVFIDGGQRFSSVEEMNQTLSIKDLDPNYKNTDIIYYDVLGKRYDSLEHCSKGLYIIEYRYMGKVERKKYVLR